MGMVFLQGLLAFLCLYPLLPKSLLVVAFLVNYPQRCLVAFSASEAVAEPMKLMVSLQHLAVAYTLDYWARLEHWQLKKYEKGSLTNEI